MSATIDVKLHLSRQAPRDARRAADGALGDVPARVRDDIRLLVSELVTNSVRHAGLDDGGWVRLRVAASTRYVRVEIVDPGTGFDMPDEPGPRAEGGGLGLYLLRKLADRWGMVRNHLTSVWFELDLA
jgi:anti-sigma regulatory factor (Ser/Thr protein kinase)